MNDIYSKNVGRRSIGNEWYDVPNVCTERTTERTTERPNVRHIIALN